MSIALLSNSTVRAIGSSLVLNDAASVVKELIDNALDANASIISVEISANTLDVIQIKDNGSGIGLEDRQRICKRGYTSKIRTLDDLEQLGGTSLGFRGEALASVAELSESVTVITCVEGERAGTGLRFGPTGTLLSSSSAPHPVGTTIRVRDFLKKIPVRKQTAIKAASRTLTAIKKLLYTYAFARPVIRFVMKVLKGKNNKANWLYAANPGSTLVEAAARIVGKAAATHCEFRNISRQCRLEKAESNLTCEIDALLVRATGDVSQTHNVGHFMSIDGRPVNSVRSSMKEIVKLYRSYFRSALQRNDGSTSSVDPFLCMHIRCPPGSYDVNIEPSKDEVLFLDLSNVISAVEQLLADFYGELNIHTAYVTSEEDKTVTVNARSFNLLMAKKPNSAAKDNAGERNYDTEDGRRHHRPNIALSQMESPLLAKGRPNGVSVNPSDGSKDEPQRNAAKTFANMYSWDDDACPEFQESILEPDDGKERIDDDNDEEGDLQSSKVTNPWSIAKMHASLRPKPAQEVSSRTLNVSESITPTTSAHGSSPEPMSYFKSQRAPPHGSMLLPSPSVSPLCPSTYQIPGPPIRTRAPTQRREGNEEGVEFTQLSNGDGQTLRRGTGIETWAKPLHSTVQVPSLKRASESTNKDGRFGEPSVKRFEVHPGSVEEASMSQSLKPLPSTRDHTEIQNTRKSLRSPTKNPNLQGSPGRHSDRMFNQPPGPSSPESRQSAGVGLPSTAHAHPSLRGSLDAVQMLPLSSPNQRSVRSSQSWNEELAQIMDFEHRKKAAVKQHRQGQLRIGRPFHNPAKLAGIQRKVDLESTDTEPTHIESDVLLDNPAALPSLHHTPFDARFGDVAEIQEQKSSQSNNPHRNRFLAASKSLTHAHPNSDTRPNMEASSPDLRMTVDSTGLSEDDPRAFLIRHQQDLKNPQSSGLGTGLKIRRTKTFRLPFETIPVEIAMHDIVAIPPDPLPDIPSLQESCKTLRNVDRYVGSGHVDTVTWSPYEMDVGVWEKRLRDMIVGQYRARIGDVETVVPAIEIALSRALKAHVDGNA